MFETTNQISFVLSPSIPFLCHRARFHSTRTKPSSWTLKSFLVFLLFHHHETISWSTIYLYLLLYSINIYIYRYGGFVACRYPQISRPFLGGPPWPGDGTVVRNHAARCPKKKAERTLVELTIVNYDLWMFTVDISRYSLIYGSL